MGSAFKNKGV
jgi:elongation factor G